MVRRIVILVFLLFFLCSSKAVYAINQIEIFHINEGKVVKTVTWSKEIQAEVEQLFTSITDIFRGIQPIPTRGYMIKFPIEPAYKLTNEWMNNKIIEVIMIFPENENPYLMLFEEEGKFYFFVFNKSVNDLLDKLDFVP